MMINSWFLNYANIFNEFGGYSVSFLQMLPEKFGFRSVKNATVSVD